MSCHFGALRRRCLAAILQTQRKQQRFPNYKFNTWTAFPAFQSTETPSSSTIASGPKLPPAYLCTEQWEKRLETPILKKVELEDMFYQMDLKYQPDKVISPIDVDLYVNKVTEEENVEEMEELIYRLRKSPSAIDTLPSTSHAFIRTLVHLDKTDMLFRILNDRMNYGIFLDYYTANIFMDKFINVGNYKDSARVAGLLMLQEDFGPPITKFFAILSCLKFLQTEIPVGTWETEPETDDSKEEVKYRVKYLRNPYFDDHFELTEPQSIVGKTLAYAALQVTEDKAFANSIQIYGWALYDKWLKVEQSLTQLRDSKQAIYAEVLSKILALAESRLAQIEASPDKKLPKPNLRPVIGLNLEPAEVATAFERLNWDAQTSLPLPRVKQLLASTFVTSEVTLESKVNDLLTSAIAERSDLEVAEMKALYEQWETQRVVELDRQIERFKEIQLLLQHQQIKKDLKEREETIFFFDNEEEWMMKVEEKEAAEIAAKAAANVVKPTMTPGTKPGVKAKKEDDSDYVSPIL